MTNTTKRVAKSHLIDFEKGSAACGEKVASLGVMTFAREPREKRCHECHRIFKAKESRGELAAPVFPGS